MKVYSWPTLLGTVFAGVVLLLWAAQDAARGDWVSGVLWGILALYLLFRGVGYACSKERVEVDRQRASRGKEIYRKSFGRFAPIMPYLHVVMILVAGVLALAAPWVPWLRWPALALLAAAVAYMIWIVLWFRSKDRQG